MCNKKYVSSFFQFICRPKFDKLTLSLFSDVTAGTLVDIRPGNAYQIQTSKERPGEQLTTFCWTGEGKSLLALWKTVSVSNSYIFHTNVKPISPSFVKSFYFCLQVQLTIQDENFSIYKGDNASHVAHLHESMQQSWFSFLPWKEKSVSICPFEPSCTGVYSNSNYSLKLDVRRKPFCHYYNILLVH